MDGASRAEEIGGGSGAHRASAAVLGVIALGGVIGAEARYGLTLLIPAAPGSFPWAVVAINIAGGLFMGALMALLSGSPREHPLTRPFVGVGILGGFTTFSTYSTDTFHLIDAGRPLAAAGYVTLTLAGALLAVVAGQALVSAFVGTAPAGSSRREAPFAPSTSSSPSGLPDEVGPEDLP